MDSLSKLPSTPFIGLKVEYTCINCEQTRFSKIVDHNDHDDPDLLAWPNDDGSFIYKIKVECQACAYVNGRFIPIFYNLYDRGVIA